MLHLKSQPQEIPFIKPRKTVSLHSPGSGIFQLKKMVGKEVQKGDLLAPQEGIITSITTYPQVFEGQKLTEITLKQRYTQTTSKLGFSAAPTHRNLPIISDLIFLILGHL